MRWELLFICVVSPWISAGPVSDGNKPNENTTYETTDETRRKNENQPSENRFEAVMLSTITRSKDENEESTNVQIYDQNPKVTLEQIENGGLCKNADFLVKILSVMLPLLKQDVPENKKTSYILLILKDLLKSSPEAAHNHEVMYKINDLLQTLEKYHVKGLDFNKKALRDSNHAISSPHGFATNIVLKYDVPIFENPNCTAELLKIIKVVQKAILTLVNNPLCKSELPKIEPFLTNADALLINPELYLPGRYPSNIYPDSSLPYLPYKEYPSDNEDIPITHNAPGSAQIYPIPETEIHEAYNNDNKEPNSKQTYPIFYTNFPEKEPVVTEEGDMLPYKPYLNDINTKKIPSYQYKPIQVNKYPESNRDKLLYYPLNPYYDSSPSSSPLVNGNINRKPVYPIENEGKPAPGGRGSLSIDKKQPDYEIYWPNNIPSTLPQEDSDSSKSEEYFSSEVNQLSKKPSLPFKVASGGSGNIQIGLPIDLNLNEFSTSSNSPFQVTGDTSSVVQFWKNQPNSDFKYAAKRPKPYLEIDFPNVKSGDDYSREIPIGQNDPTFEFDLPSKKATFYSEMTLPSSIPSPPPFEVSGDGSGEFYKDSNQPNPIFEYNFPLKHPKSYLKIDLSKPNSSPSPFEVIGDGSGEVQIGDNLPYPDFEYDLPSKRPKPYLKVDAPSSSSSPIEITENSLEDSSEEIHIRPNRPNPTEISGDGLGETHIDQNEPYPALEFDFPPKHPMFYSEVDLPLPSSNPSPFDVTGDGSGEVQIRPNRPKHAGFKFDLPSNHPKSKWELNFLSSSSSPSPLKVTGNGSELVQISHKRPRPIFESDMPSKQPELYLEDLPVTDPTFSPFEVDGSAGSAYIPLGQPSSKLRNIYFIRPEKKTPQPIKYDSSPNSLPSISGRPDLSPNNPLFPHDKSFGIDDRISPRFPTNYFRLFKNKPDKVQFESSPKLPPDSFIDSFTNSLPPDYFDYYDMRVDSYLPNNVLPPKTPNIYPHKNNPVPEKDENDSVPVNSLYPKFQNQDKSLPSFERPEESELLTLEPKDISVHHLTQDEDVIITKPIKLHPPKFHVANQYLKNKYPYQEKLHSEEFSLEDLDVPSNGQPILWNNGSPNRNPNKKIPKLAYPLSPDKNILIIIKDNIGIIEQKIPKINLDTFIGEHIKKIKELINLEQITVEEYVTILNRYAILIEYIKHLNISNGILKELLLSLTNGGKLEFQTGKSHVIELTYLIKRPKPLVYQPYYYIKYRLPYASFLARLENILATEPQLGKYPAKIYKALIPMSKVAETSPDLEGYGKEDITRITFNNGTLVGAKLIKGKDVDMYDSLDILKEINTDFTIEDVYRLIKSLYGKLNNTEKDSWVFENGNVADRNNFDNVKNTKVQKISVQLRGKPSITTVTKITTKKVTSDKVIENILNQVNNLKINHSTYSTGQRKELSSANPTIPLSERSLNTDQLSHFNDLVKPVVADVPIEDTVKIAQLNYQKNPKEIGKYEIAHDYVPTSSTSYEVPNYPVQKKSNGQEPDLNKLNSKHIPELTSHMKTKLIAATLNAYNKPVNNLNQNLDFTSDSLMADKGSSYLDGQSDTLSSYWKTSPYKPLDSSIGAKLLDATLKAHNYKQVNNPQDL